MTHTAHGLQGFNLNVPTLLDLKRFDAVEIDAIEQWEDNTERIDEDQIDSNPEANYFWSVYLHCNPKHPANEGHGGVECVGDFPTKPMAESFALWLESAIRWANEEAKATA